MTSPAILGEPFFTPTSVSWLNAVEGFLAKLSRHRLKRGFFRSLADLQAAIHRFVPETNNDPKPLVWNADPALDDGPGSACAWLQDATSAPAGLSRLAI